MSFDKESQRQWIPVKNLSVVWSAAQRKLDEKRVEKMAAVFDPDLFDDLVVTLPNGDGIYHVVDGQHRRGMIQTLYGEEETVPCRVISANDPRRAATIFDQINSGRKKPYPVEQFKVRVTAGMDPETHINAILDNLGYKVSQGHTGSNNIQSVGALVTVYKNFGSAVLKEALETIKATWADDNGALAANVIKGYGALIGEHRGHIDFKRLREVVGKNLTPGQLIGKSRYHAELFKCSAADAVKFILVHTYNTGLKNGKL